MITQLAQIAKIDALLSKLSIKRFNAILPVTVEVLQKSEPQKYDLKIGAKELSTKSAIDLEVGKKYWAVMGENMKTGTISLSKLLKNPAFFQKGKEPIFLPEVSARKMMEILSSKSPKAHMKTIFLNHLGNAGSKQEFMTLANMILALNENIFTMFLKHEQNRTLFQFKKRASQSQTSSEDGIIDFYAAFEHIGPLEGIVEIDDRIRRLTLYLYYEQSLEFLKEELIHLDFETKVVHKQRVISPLYEPVSSLLDLKG